MRLPLKRLVWPQSGRSSSTGMPSILPRKADMRKLPGCMCPSHTLPYMFAQKRLRCTVSRILGWETLDCRP